MPWTKRCMGKAESSCWKEAAFLLGFHFPGGQEPYPLARPWHEVVLVCADVPALCSKAKDTLKKQVFSVMGRKITEIKVLFRIAR